MIMKALDLGTTTVVATDIRNQPADENDTEISVTVMRSCTFLTIRSNGRVVVHADISREDWQRIASTPRPEDR
jgi:hypothetical protein